MIAQQKPAGTLGNVMRRAARGVSAPRTILVGNSGPHTALLDSRSISPSSPAAAERQWPEQRGDPWSPASSPWRPRFVEPLPAGAQVPGFVAASLGSERRLAGLCSAHEASRPRRESALQLRGISFKEHGFRARTFASGRMTCLIARCCSGPSVHRAIVCLVAVHLVCNPSCEGLPGSKGRMARIPSRAPVLVAEPWKSAKQVKTRDAKLRKTTLASPMSLHGAVPITCATGEP